MEFKRYIEGQILVTNGTSGTKTQYLIKDHLGSTELVLNHSTSGDIVAEDMSFDAWGQRRKGNNWTPMTTIELMNFDSSTTTKGFTGHEMLDEVGLIHMNGRIYDPRLGRFMQADLWVQYPTNLQSYNLYGYVHNNPLRFVDPSGYGFFDKLARPFKHVIRGIFKILGPEISSAIVNIGSMFCGPAAPLCKAVGTYDLNRAFGASPKDARRAAGVAGASQWAFGDNTGATPTWGDATFQLGLNAVAAEDPALGQALMFVSGNWGEMDPSVWFQNAVGATLQYQASKVIAREAARHGLTLQEFNLILALNSKIGLKIAGTTFDEESGTVQGFASREVRPTLGVLWDINDTLLNAQGLLDAVSLQIVDSGYGGSLKGHSLGAARVNNLHRQGLISGATTLSLPFFAFPSAGSKSYCGSRDSICGGSVMSALRPNTQSVDTPSPWDMINQNHRLSSVPQYERIWRE